MYIGPNPPQVQDNVEEIQSNLASTVLTEDPSMDHSFLKQHSHVRPTTTLSSGARQR